jgi:hypothetical protein
VACFATEDVERLVAPLQARLARMHVKRGRRSVDSRRVRAVGSGAPSGSNVTHGKCAADAPRRFGVRLVRGVLSVFGDQGHDRRAHSHEIGCGRGIGSGIVIEHVGERQREDRREQPIR